MQRPGERNVSDDTINQFRAIDQDALHHKQLAHFGGKESNYGAQTGYNFGTINVNTTYNKRGPAMKYDENPPSHWSREDEVQFLSSLELWSDANLGSTIPPPLINTCTWILERDEFKAWLQPDGQSLLFITGGSGSGKSCLARFLADHFRKDDSNVVIDFYCRTIEAADEYQPLMPYLVHQLLLQNRHDFKYVFPRYQSRVLRAKGPSLGMLYDIFCAIARGRLRASNSHTTYLIIDGLDELPHDYIKELLARIDALFTPETGMSTCPNFKLVILAQGTILIRGRAEAHLQLQMTAEDTKADIEGYVRREMTRIAQYRKYPDGLQRELESLICDRAEGYFIWVVLALADLEDMSKDISSATVFETINECFSDLGSRYANAFKRIRWLDDVLVEKLFIIVIGSFQSLSVAAIESALTINARHKARSIDLRGKILVSCSNLLKIDGHDRVTLVHPSLQRFLTQTNEGQRQLHIQDICSSRDKINAVVGTISLKYMLQPGIASLWRLKETMSHTEIRNIVDTEYPFLFYAINYWNDHVRNMIEINDEVCGLIQKLFEVDLDAEFTPAVQVRAGYSTCRYNLLIQISIGVGHDIELIPLTRLPVIAYCAAENLNSVFRATDVFGRCASIRPVKGRNVVFSWLGQHLGFLANSVEPTWRIRTGESLDIFDDNGMNPLHLAAQHGSLEMLCALLECGEVDIDLKSREECSFTALHYAAWEENIECLRILLHYGANANLTDSNGATALHLVASIRDLSPRHEGIALLLEHGANVDFKDSGGCPPLIVAMDQQDIDDKTLLLLDGPISRLCHYNQLTLLTYIVANGHKELLREIIPRYEGVLDSKDGFGYTALHHAVESGDLSMVQVLITYGFDVNAVSGIENGAHKVTCLQIAIEFGHELILACLLDTGADPNLTCSYGVTLLTHAVTNGTTAMVNSLLAAGALVNRPNEDGRTALFAAVFPGVDPGMLRLLLTWSAQVGIVDWCNLNVLHFAAWYDNQDALQKLLGVSTVDDINTRDVECYTPLYYACFHGHIDIVQALLNAGGDVSLIYPGRTPKVIDLAVDRGHHEIARLLLRNGADPIGGRLPYWSPFHEAACRGETDLFLSLLGTTPPRDVFEPGLLFNETPIYIACEHGNLDFIKVMMGLGADIHPALSGERSLMHAACYSGNVDLVRYLREASPALQTVDVTTHEGYSPLMVACERGHIDVAKYLIGEGADPNISSFDGLTCLHLAAQSDSVNLCQLLIDQNVDLNKTDIHGRSALHMAVLAKMKDNPEMVETLLKSGIDVSIPAYPSKWPALFVSYDEAEKPDRSFQKLLEHPRTNLRQPSQYGITVLHFALTDNKLLHAARIATFAYTVPGEMGSDLLDELLLLRDGFGRRPYDIITSQWFSSEQSLWDTWTNERAAMMASASKSIIEAIENARPDPSDGSAYYYLASLLLLVGDEEEAKFWLCQNTRFWEHADIHGANCDGCDQPIRTNRYVCRLCENVDLCEPCMWQYVRGTLRKSPCHNHSFFKIGMDELVIVESESDDEAFPNDKVIVANQYTTPNANTPVDGSSIGAPKPGDTALSNTEQPIPYKRRSEIEVRSRLEDLHEKYSLLHKVFTECAEREARENAALERTSKTNPSIFLGMNLPLMLWKPCTRVWRPTDIGLLSVHGTTQYRCARGCPREELD